MSVSRICCLGAVAVRAVRPGIITSRSHLKSYFWSSTEPAKWKVMAENEHLKIADVKVKSVVTGEEIAMSDLWAEKTCVIAFLRRFGCMLCRTGAKELSAIKPTLDANGIRLAGIGVEEFGLQDFLSGEYFNGELYIDTRKECYQRLGYKRFNMLSIIPAVFGSKGREAIAKSRAAGISGDLKGDGMQNGGLMIVKAGGEKTIFSWHQPEPGTHLDPKLILEELGITSPD